MAIRYPLENVAVHSMLDFGQKPRGTAQELRLPDRVIGGLERRSDDYRTNPDTDRHYVLPRNFEEGHTRTFAACRPMDHAGGMYFQKPLACRQD